MFYIFTSLILLLVIAVLLFINISPQIGGKPTEKDIARYEKSKHYSEGEFVNEKEVSLNMSPGKMFSTIIKFFKGIPNGAPKKDIEVLKVDSMDLKQQKLKDKLIWFGHSAFLLQLEGKNILLDPMFGKVPAPHPALGRNRYSSQLPIEIEKLPEIDAIVISHDHYDHLDYGSIQKLKGKTKLFFVPLGVGAHFKAWGVPENKIKELDWWDEQHLAGFKLKFAPSQHFSGRSINDRNHTLWGSWIIETANKNIYFSGDGGYGDHFKEIGERYGPFDLALVECGQYNENWHDIHMMPEESAQAAVDLRAKVAMPIHWGAFTLSLHSWTEPVERIQKAAKTLDIPLITPEIGKVVEFEKLSENIVTERDSVWWKKQ